MPLNIIFYRIVTQIWTLTDAQLFILKTRILKVMKKIIFLNTKKRF